MAATFDEIGSVTADGTTTSIEVTGIDQSYDDLHVIFEFFIATTGTPSAYIRVNGDTATGTYNSDTMVLEGSGSWTYQEDYNAYSGWRMINSPSNSGSGTPYHWGNIMIDMMEYTATRTKSFIAHRCTFNEVGTNSAIGAAGLGYRGTSAISSITLAASNNIGNGSTITVYGIANS